MYSSVYDLLGWAIVVLGAAVLFGIAVVTSKKYAKFFDFWHALCQMQLLSLQMIFVFMLIGVVVAVVFYSGALYYACGRCVNPHVGRTPG